VILNPAFVGVMSDGSFVVGNELIQASTTLNENTIEFVRFGSDGSVLDTIGRFPLVRSEFISELRLGVDELFGAHTWSAVSGQKLWVGTGRDYAVSVYSDAGRLEMSVRWEGPGRAVGPTDIDAYWRARRSAGRDVKWLRRIERYQPVAAEFAAHGRLLTATDGTVWIQEYRRPLNEGDDTWLVFNVEGLLVRTVVTPVDLTVTDVGSTYVLGTRRDKGDIEHVELMQLKAAGQ
jgi:hypothetical protein